jgi:hypothetical protein
MDRKVKNKTWHSSAPKALVKNYLLFMFTFRVQIRIGFKVWPKQRFAHNRRNPEAREHREQASVLTRVATLLLALLVAQCVKHFVELGIHESFDSFCYRPFRPSQSSTPVKHAAY